MIIHRSRPTNRYTVIPNATLRDPRLSYVARGVLVEVLSRPDDWSANADGLAELAKAQRGEAGESRRKIRAVFAELETAGYLRRLRIRTPRGQMVTELHVFDVSQTDDTTGGMSAPPARTRKTAGRADVPDGWYLGGDGTDDTTGGTSAPPARTRKTAGRADVPLTDVSVGGTSIRSTDNEVPEESLSPRAGSLHAALNAAVPGVTERETELALKELKSRGVRSASAVLRAEIRDGGAAALVAEVRRNAEAAMLTFLPLCGQCDNRYVYDDQGRAIRCPRCHPAVQHLPREAEAS